MSNMTVKRPVVVVAAITLLLTGFCLGWLGANHLQQKTRPEQPIGHSHPPNANKQPDKRGLDADRTELQLDSLQAVIAIQQAKLQSWAAAQQQSKQLLAATEAELQRLAEELGKESLAFGFMQDYAQQLEARLAKLERSKEAAEQQPEAEQTSQLLLSNWASYRTERLGLLNFALRDTSLQWADWFQPQQTTNKIQFSQPASGVTITTSILEDQLIQSAQPQFISGMAYIGCSVLAGRDGLEVRPTVSIAQRNWQIGIMGPSLVNSQSSQLLGLSVAKRFLFF